MKNRYARLILSFGLVLFASAQGCYSPDGKEVVAQDSTATAESELIRSPQPSYVTQDLASRGLSSPATGGDATVLDQEIFFDSRRDVWEDEWPTIGEDPSRWNESAASRQATHGLAPVETYGFQWLRSYARNATVVFTTKDDLDYIDPITGKYYAIKPAWALDSDRMRARLARMTQGWDLCPEQRFAEQIQGGRVPLIWCSGTLIDKNIILTASHCVRDSQTGIPDTPIEDVRVVFNYVVAHRGAEPSVDTHRDVFAVRELITLQKNGYDVSLLQLVSAVDGTTPISDLDPAYVPVPIWDADLPHADQRWRPGAAIGAGAKLPVKISPARARGWMTDRLFAGFASDADIYPGNSGGGFYDVDSGTLIGVVSQETPNKLTVRCPTDPDELDGVTYPDCWLTPGDRDAAEKDSEALNFMPAWSLDSKQNYVWRGCMKWSGFDVPHDEALAFEELLHSYWGLPDSVERGSPPVTVPAVSVALAKESSSTLGGMVMVGPTVRGIRQLICEPAATTGDRTTLVGTIVSTLSSAYDEARSLLTQANNQCIGNLCPSYSAYQAKLVASEIYLGALMPGEVPVGGVDPIIAKLRASVLCTKVVPQATMATWQDTPKLNPQTGRETTYHGTTLGAGNYFSTTRDGPGAVPDALYAVRVDNWTVLYADTFSGGAYLGAENSGTNFDTTLQLWQEVGASSSDSVSLDASNWTSVFTDPLDDSGCPGDEYTDFFQQSQMVGLLEPGKRYLLQVSGFYGEVGDYNLHVQATPSPMNGQIIDKDTPYTIETKNGVQYRVYTVNPLASPGTLDACDPVLPWRDECMYNAVPQIMCQGKNSGDWALIAKSCPLYRGSPYSFRVVGTSSLLTDYADDASAAVIEGHIQKSKEGYLCSDDTQKSMSFLGFKLPYRDNSAAIGEASFVSSVGGVEDTLNSGAAVRAFYAHQFTTDLNWSNLHVQLKIPEGAAHY